MFYISTFRPKALYLILIFFLAFTGQSSSQEITVMTYNVYHGENPYRPGKSNLKEVAEIINAQNPDFVALQEVESMTERTAGFNAGERINVAKELGDMTGMAGLFGKAIDFSNRGYGEGLLVQNRTFRILSFLISQGDGSK